MASINLHRDISSWIDYASGVPKFRDINIGTDKLYSEEIFLTIWNHFKTGNEEAIIKLLKSDPVLRDRNFSLIKETGNKEAIIKSLKLDPVLFDRNFSWIRSRSINKVTTFLELACYFYAEKVVTFIINSSDVWYKGPRDLVNFISQPSNPSANLLSTNTQYGRVPDQVNFQGYGMYSPLDKFVDLSGSEDSFAGSAKSFSRLFDLVLNSGRVRFYTIIKNVNLISKTISSLRYVLNPKIDVGKEIEFNSGCLKKIEVGPDKFSILQNSSDYFSTDLIEIYPDLIFRIAQFANQSMFESVMRYYYRQEISRQEISQISYIISECTSIPFSVAQMISDYCPYFLTQKVKDVVTLTCQVETSFSGFNYYGSKIETPFLHGFSTLWEMERVKKACPSRFRDMPRQEIKSRLEFLKFLLESGEDIDRLPRRPNDNFFYSYLKDLKIKDVDTLVDEFFRES